MNDRIRWIDMARGIMMCLVVMGHALAETNTSNLSFARYVYTALFMWINTFHMPAFFILSGILYDEKKNEHRTICTFVKNKVVSIVLPYFVFEGIAVVLHVYIFKQKELVSALKDVLTIRCNLGADWFLPTLFFAEILLFVVMKATNSVFKLAMGIGSFCFAFFLDGEYHFQRIVGRCLIAFFFLVIGNVFRSCFSKKIRLLYLCAVLLITLVVAFVNGTVSMFNLTLNNPILFALGAVMGSYMIFNIGMLLELDAIEAIGKNSLIIMGTHQHVIYCVRYLGMTIYGGVPTLILFMTMIMYSKCLCLVNCIMKRVCYQVVQSKKN